ncbi:MAG: glycoside hydrolase family 16 protein [Clostridia bacterium]|nr:glycoside hydrolase family 16 protein [Clostridia bacterium]
MEALLTLLKFAVRQKMAFYAGTDMLKQILTFKVPFTKIGAALMAAVELFSAAFWDTPRTPRGPELDLTGYEIVFEDNFDGDELNTDVWNVTTSGSSTGFYDPSALTVKDGNLTITAEYKDGPQGKGWYTGDMRLYEKYCKGYFEIRCKAYPNQKRGDFWSAFWLSVYGEYIPEVSQGGPGGCEIDIEWFSESTRGDRVVGITPAVWLNGADDDPEIDGINFGDYAAQKDPVEEYNTYGILWTDTEYIWYINGVEAVRTSYAKGVSEVPEELIVTLCSPSKASTVTRTAEDPVGEYVIDYIRIWQLP